jgi:hypothetical protein
MAVGSIFVAPTQNYFSTTLNGAINDSVTTITLNSTTNLQAPGYLVIDREDGSGTATPNSREVISFTGISGSDITGVTRDDDGSTARSHSDGALVESVMTVGTWNSLATAVATHATPTGTITTGSAATIAERLTASALVVPSIASIARTESDKYAGFQGAFTWTKSSALVTSLITSTSPLQMLRATKDLSLITVWIGLQSAPSVNAFKTDIRWSAGPTGDFASVFTANNQPMIDVGEYTTVSAASPGILSLTSLASGIVFKPEILQPGDAGDMTIQLVAKER